MKDHITLSQGSGGKEMDELISSFGLGNRKGWKSVDDDGAMLDLGDKELVFTTDSFVVDPIFFPGGDIGHISFCGTVNDLLMMGATPLGLSLALVIEEGFPRSDLDRILSSIRSLSDSSGIPIATGDTKVMEKGKVDKIIINTSGVGLKEKGLMEGKAIQGDKVIISGGIGEHAAALLSRRFDFSTELLSDAKTLIDEISSVSPLIKCAKDPTRGGIAAVLNEISSRYKVMIELDEKKIPIRKEVNAVSDLLGIDPFQLASEGRMVCICSEKDSQKVLDELKRFNPMASIIGEIKEGKGVILKTKLGKSIMPVPCGRIVTRIC